MFYSTFEGCVDSILQSNMNTIRVLLKCSLTCSWVHVVVVVVVVVLLISLVEVVPRVGLGPTRVHGGLCSSSIPATVILCLYISTQRVICNVLTCGSPQCKAGGKAGRKECCRTALHTGPPQAGTDPSGILLPAQDS